MRSTFFLESEAVYFSKKVATFQINLPKAVFSTEKSAVKAEVYMTTNNYSLYATLYGITLKQAAIFKLFELKVEHFIDAFVCESKLFSLGVFCFRHLVPYGVIHQHVTSLYCLELFACHFCKHLWHVPDEWLRPFAL
jgi:hypothetical protein